MSNLHEMQIIKRHFNLHVSTESMREKLVSKLKEKKPIYLCSFPNILMASLRFLPTCTNAESTIIYAASVCVCAEGEQKYQD